MAKPLSEIELSPLDQIRLAEAEITRNLVAAREASERSLIDARLQAAETKNQARESGTRKGTIRYKEIVSKAEEEARAVTTRAQYQADSLKQKGRNRMKAAVQYAVSVVLGLEKDGDSDES